MTLQITSRQRSQYALHFEQMTDDEIQQKLDEFMVKSPRTQDERLQHTFAQIEMKRRDGTFKIR